MGKELCFMHNIAGELSLAVEEFVVIRMSYFLAPILVSETSRKQMMTEINTEIDGKG